MKMVKARCTHCGGEFDRPYTPGKNKTMHDDCRKEARKVYMSKYMRNRRAQTA